MSTKLWLDGGPKLRNLWFGIQLLQRFVSL